MITRLIIVDGHALTKKKETAELIASKLKAVSIKICHADTSAAEYVQHMADAIDKRAHVILVSSWRADDVREALGYPSVIPKQMRRMLDRIALGCSAHIAQCKTVYPVGLLPTEEEKAVISIEGAWKSVESPLPVREISGSNILIEMDVDLLLDSMHPRVDKHINLGPGVGAWRPGEVVLLIGDRHGPSLQPYQVHSNIAFCDMAKKGSSYWLTERLVQGGIREDRLYWINAYDSDGQATSAEFIRRLHPITVCTLGDSAARWCQTNGVRYEHFTHPQYHKRFKSSEPYPLIERLQEICGDNQ